MDWLQTVWALVGELDQALLSFVTEYGRWTYGLLFLVVFCETGLVVTPFLPGDSLLFSAGALAGMGALDVAVLCGTLSVAAIAGDSVNYAVGNALRGRVVHGLRFVNRRHLERTERFYQRHGGKAVVLARFAPILRTFVPFVAGVAGMSYRRFFLYNVVGGIAWVGLFALAGFFFGNLPVVKDNLTLVLAGVILVSLLPVFLAGLESRPEPPAHVAP